MDSREQKEWVILCTIIRSHLIEQAKLVEAMTVKELCTFCKTIDDALWTEMKAKSYDAALEGRLASLERETAFGG